MMMMMMIMMNQCLTLSVLNILTTSQVLVEHNSRSKFRASSSNLSYLETSVEATNRCDVVLGRRIHLLMIVAL